MLSRLARPRNVNAILLNRLLPNLRSSTNQVFNHSPVRFASSDKNLTDKFYEGLQDNLDVVGEELEKKIPAPPSVTKDTTTDHLDSLENFMKVATEEEQAALGALADSLLKDGELSPDLFESETVSQSEAAADQLPPLDGLDDGQKKKLLEEYMARHPVEPLEEDALENALKETPVERAAEEARRQSLGYGKASDAGESYGPMKNEFDTWKRIYKEEESLERLGLPPRAHYWRDGEMYSPFGTLSKPVQIYSKFANRIVGCRGGNGTPHEVTWINLGSKYKTMCPECGQMYQLVAWDPAEHEEPGEDLELLDKTSGDGQLKEPQFY